MTFVTVEGLDGAGKTYVCEHLHELYRDSTLTYEPSTGEYGQQVRERLSEDDSDPLIDFFLFMADRRDHIKHTIEPALETGDIVISDRYADSTRAYQSVALSDTLDVSTGYEALDRVGASIFINYVLDFYNLEPDLTLYLDVSVDTAIERLTDGETDPEKYENREFLERVQSNYESLVENRDRIVAIDAEQPKDDVLDDVVKTLADAVIDGDL